MLFLPHVSSIRNWISSVDAEPGFLTNVLSKISQYLPHERECNLVFDAISIRKSIVWDPAKGIMSGFCNFGGAGESQDDGDQQIPVDYGNKICLEGNEIPATQALVFMLVSLCGKFKWPIAYFLIHSLTANILAELVKDALVLSHKFGVKIWSVTCHGTYTNLLAMKYLGCDIFCERYVDLRTYFFHPSTNEKVFFTPDACHNVKLARNTLGDLKTLVSDGGTVEWQYIEKLHDLQLKLKLKIANKLTSAHIDFRKNIMKVRLAAQVLSSSVADALSFLAAEEVPGFEYCEPTVEYVQAINAVFDFLNSKNPYGKGLKAPIRLKYLMSREDFITKKINYLYDLSDVDGNLIVTGNRKTFIVGFAVAVKSILSLAREILVPDSYYSYLLTYNFSQDFLELFFAVIRRRFGTNNNPNILQLKSALKNIILKNYVNAPRNANCQVFDEEDFGCLLDVKWNKNRKKSRQITDDELQKSDLSLFANKSLLSPQNYHLKENIVYYISGFVVRCIIQFIDCSTCIEALNRPLRAQRYSCTDYTIKLSTLKNRGGLVCASESVYRIVLATENALINTTNNFQNMRGLKLEEMITGKIKNNFAQQSQIFIDCARCDINIMEPSHRLNLIELITRQYLKIRLNTYGRFHSLEVINPVSKRQKYNKLVLLGNM